MITRIRAAILDTLGSPLRVDNFLEVPEVTDGKVLVALAHTGVCHSQLAEIRGDRGINRYLPHLLGHEGSGVVKATGPGVTKVRTGDRVILTWIKGAGVDAGGTIYPSPSGPINAGPVTTFNDFALISENRLVLLPPGIPMDVGVLFGCALPTGGGIILNELNAQDGSTLVVFGLGGVGLCALMVAVASGSFSKVIAVDVSDQKLRFAEELGATTSINAQGDVVQMVRDATGGEGADFAVDASGRAEVIEMAFDSVRRNGGLCVFASHPPAGARISIDPFELINGKHIRGSWGGACQPDRDIPRFAEMYLSGRLPLEKLLTRRYQLEEINEAVADLEAGVALRPLIELDSSIT